MRVKVRRPFPSPSSSGSFMNEAVPSEKVRLSLDLGMDDKLIRTTRDYFRSGMEITCLSFRLHICRDAGMWVVLCTQIWGVSKTKQLNIHASTINIFSFTIFRNIPAASTQIPSTSRSTSSPSASLHMLRAVFILSCRP